MPQIIDLFPKGGKVTGAMNICPCRGNALKVTPNSYGYSSAQPGPYVEVKNLGLGTVLSIILNLGITMLEESFVV